MSDDTEVQGGATLHSTITSAVGRPGPLHADLWNMIEDLVDRRVQEAMPQLAEVRGNDGGAVRVRMDDEDEDREFGFARKHGQRYKKGDRVLVQKLRGGEFVVHGTYSDKQGQGQRAVGDDDMEDDAIDRRALKKNAVGKEQIEGGSITKNHMTSNSVGSDEIMSNSVDKGHLKNNSVGSSQLEGNSVDTNHLKPNAVNGTALASNSVDTGHIKNNSVTKDKLAPNAAPDLSDYAKKSDLNGYLKSSDVRAEAKGSKALATEEWVKANYEPKKKS